MKNITNIFTKGLNLVLPHRCYDCGKKVADPFTLCDQCLETLELCLIRKPCCSVCTRPLEQWAGNGAICRVCADKRPAFEKLVAVSDYDAVARRLILRLKHSDRPDIAKILAAWLMVAAKDVMGDIDGFVPVPMHVLRRLQRPYNHAGLLAGALSGFTKKPCHTRVLKRTRFTKSQGRKGRPDRRANVHDAFQVVNKKAVEGKSIALIDDVVTTGSTADQCAKALKAAGCRSVYVFAVARV
ncbi:MAG: ComF family protein [Alphaproteobacteria bacterium]|nr:ComF family protein [Alphaproteobacteria bacterium]